MGKKNPPANAEDKTTLDLGKIHMQFKSVTAIKSALEAWGLQLLSLSCNWEV